MSAPAVTEPTEAELLAEMEVLEAQLIRLLDAFVADIAANAPEPAAQRRARRGGGGRA